MRRYNKTCTIDSGGWPHESQTLQCPHPPPFCLSRLRKECVCIDDDLQLRGSTHQRSFVVITSHQLLVPALPTVVCSCVACLVSVFDIAKLPQQSMAAFDIAAKRRRVGDEFEQAGHQDAHSPGPGPGPWAFTCERHSDYKVRFWFYVTMNLSMPHRNTSDFSCVAPFQSH